MSSQERILVVEDESDVLELIRLHLNRKNYEVIACGDGGVALERLRNEKYDLAVLDWMLPGVSGIELCKLINRRMPVLMVTAKAESADVIAGLEAGADDYVTKPFEIPVLLARVAALLRRAKAGAATIESAASDRLKFGEFTIDTGRHEVMGPEGSVQLTPSEFKLLVALVGAQGKVLSRQRLIEMVQGNGVVVVDRTVDTHVFGLRKKLGQTGDLIETIRGVGYRVRHEA